jgi:hypothetical protein
MTFWLQFSPSISDTPQKKLVIDFIHDDQTGFGVHVIAVDGSDKKDVLHIGLDLTDENFFKTHFTWSTDAIKSIVVSS